ncbi:MAG: nuclear transport factor 2 family protein [bacterium]|nr:nuclear transport factor 2 family protein [bacterium]
MRLNQSNTAFATDLHADGNDSTCNRRAAWHPQEVPSNANGGNHMITQRQMKAFSRSWLLFRRERTIADEPEESRGSNITIAPQEFAEQWIDAWNRRDIDAVMAFYADDAEVRSPLAARMAPGSRGVLRGADALRTYYGRLIETRKDLRFELTDCLTGVNGLTAIYRGLACMRVAEAMTLDDSGKVVKSDVFYSRPV